MMSGPWVTITLGRSGLANFHPWNYWGLVEDIDPSSQKTQTRDRPPARNLRNYSSLSPPRSLDEMWQKGPTGRDNNAPRVRFFSSRHTGLASATVPEIARPVAPSSGMMQRGSNGAEEPATVSGFLHSLGSGKYAISFQAEEVDMTELRQMRDKDLKDMGIPLGLLDLQGPRKKILQNLMSQRKQQ